MPRTSLIVLLLLSFGVAACNKSSPPPQNPVKPRTILVGGG